MQNPLLDFTGLPLFDQIQPSHIAPAMQYLLEQANHRVEQITARTLNDCTWENTILALDEVCEQLGRAWGVVGHLKAVTQTAELREAYNAHLPILSAFYTQLGQNLALYERYKYIAAQESAHLSSAEQQWLNHELRDFVLSGAELNDTEKLAFADIQTQLAERSAEFSDHVLDATDAFSLLISDKAELDGLPESALAQMAAAAEADGKTGYKITLQFPSYFPILQYAHQRSLRETVYRAYATRASEFGKTEWDNTPTIAEILRLRQAEATLLGFKSYAELSLFTKMAETPEQVDQFLSDLAQRAKPFAEQDRAELLAFAARECHIQDLSAWDLAYVSEKLREARYAFSEEEVKQYFPADAVLAGLFQVVESLYQVKISLDHAPVWHPSVQFYRLSRQNHQGEWENFAGFYLDLYARAQKRSGAWMDEVITRTQTASGITAPIAHLVCNFTPPIGEQTALFTHDEVITLFHECGHGLHHLLTEVDARGVAGIHGVEWDAVELPSQFMENFCWEWQVLQNMTRHAETGLPLPRSLFDKMLAAKNFQSGMQTVRQIEFSLFDMRLHHQTQNWNIPTLLQDIRHSVAVNPTPEWNRFAHSFSHIFAGGYGAGYYSYKWAEVLSADAFAAFEENAIQGNVLNPNMGAAFRQHILAVGGSRPAIESFQAFRGRAPSLDALLRHHGMVANA